MDRRVLVIDNPADFSLFGQREELGFNGILYEMGVTEALESDAHAYVDYRLEQGWGQGICNAAVHFQKGVYQKTTALGITDEPIETPIAEHFKNSSIGDHAQETHSILAGYFNLATGNRICMGSIRANQYIPYNFHNHLGLSMSALGDGTVGRNTEGESYTIGSGWVFLFDEEIDHKAPKSRIDDYTEDPNIRFKRDPRVVFLMA